MDSVSAKILMQAFPETSRELRSSIRNSGFGHTMETYHLLELNVSIHVRMIVRLDRNKMNEFGQTIHDHLDQIKTLFHSG
jgi:hypothetical protein